jgi:hypothetical protein
MKKLILISLLSLTTIVCLSQDIYKVKIKYLGIGHLITDSTLTWVYPVLLSSPTVLIGGDSLVIKSEDTEMVYKFLGPKESNPGIKSFYSVELKSNKTYVVTYFTSPCKDNTSITVIVDDDKDSYNYYGDIE